MVLGIAVVLLVALVALTGALDGAAKGRLTFSGGAPPGCSECPVPGAPRWGAWFGARGPLRTKVETGDGRFRIQLRPGRYVLTSTDGTGCSAAVVVILFKTTSANLQCGAP